MQEEENEGSCSRALLAASSVGGATTPSYSAAWNNNTFPPQTQHRAAALELEIMADEKGCWDSHDNANRNNLKFCDDNDALTISGMTTSAVASPSDHHRYIYRSGSRSQQQQQRLRRHNKNWDEDGKMGRRNTISGSILSNFKHDDDDKPLEVVFDENTNFDPLLIAARNATAISNEGGFEGRGARRRRQRYLEEEEDQLQNQILQPNSTATVLLVNDCSCSSVTEEDEDDDEEEDNDDEEEKHLVESQTNTAMPPTIPSRQPLNNDFLGGLHRERQYRQQQQLCSPPYIHHSWSQQRQTHMSTTSNMDRNMDDAMDDLKMENVDRSQDNATPIDLMLYNNINSKSCRQGNVRENGRDGGSHNGFGNQRMGFDYGNTVIVTNRLTIGDEERSRKTASSSITHSSDVVTNPTTVVPKWKRSVLLPSHSSLY